MLIQMIFIYDSIYILFSFFVDILNKIPLGLLKSHIIEFIQLYFEVFYNNINY